MGSSCSWDGAYRNCVPSRMPELQLQLEDPVIRDRQNHHRLRALDLKVGKGNFDRSNDGHNIAGEPERRRPRVVKQVGGVFGRPLEAQQCRRANVGIRITLERVELDIFAGPVGIL